ncbi:hypothetical protein IT411_00830, partial [Candidatus Peregrinibacteria bacterium]|nr:hypothetical protein [Candidatus Peregrinibacteria bacterium]
MLDELTSQGEMAFEPRDRQLITFNSYDVPKLCSAGMIELGLARGSRRIYEAEGALTFHIKEQHDDPQELRQHMHEMLESFVSGSRRGTKDSRYNQIARIQPFHHQMEKLNNALDQAVEGAGMDSLTLAY